MAAVEEKPITLGDNYFRMLDEATSLAILPPQQEALKFYGFHGIYRGNNIADLYLLWRIYMMLIYTHRRPVDEISYWCQREMFAICASGILGRDSDEGRWLMQRESSLKPSCGDLWAEPAAIWYQCAIICFDSAGNEWKNDPYIREKQKCYLAFGLFSLNGYPDPSWIRHDDINIWHDFGFGTCENEPDRKELCKAYLTAIQKTSFRISSPRSRTRCPRFEIFWREYSSCNLVSWIDLYTSFNTEEKFPWLKRFLPKPDGSELEDVNDWSVWRLCQPFELRDLNTTNMPKALKEALKYYGLDDCMTVPKQQRLLSVYKRLVRYGGPGELHMARYRGRLLEFATQVSHVPKPPIKLENRVKETFTILDKDKNANIPTDPTVDPAANPGSRNRVLSTPDPDARSGRNLSLNDMLNPLPPTQPHPRC